MFRSLLPLLPERALELPWWMGEVERVDLELASHYWYLDNSRAKEELGWRPRDPQETLRDTVEDLMRRQGTVG